MPNINENLDASFKLNPNNKAAVIAVPDLEAPGIRAKHWNIPMIKAALKVKLTNFKLKVTEQVGEVVAFNGEKLPVRNIIAQLNPSSNINKVLPL